MVSGLQMREKCVRRRWRERDRRRNCDGGEEGQKFGDGGDSVVGLCRYVLCDIDGGPDGCASGDEALLITGDVQCLCSGACRVERGGSVWPVHLSLVEGGS